MLNKAEEIMNKAGEMFTSGGKVSSTRIVTLASVFAVLAVYIAHNAMAIYKGQTYVDFPANSVMLLLVMVGAKVGQHISEQVGNKNSAPHSVPPKEPLPAPRVSPEE